MKTFLDTANLQEIRQALSWNLLDGVTTNPTLISREGKTFEALAEEICNTVPGPVNLEVTSTTKDEMVKEGRYLSDFGKNVVVKVPIVPAGINALRVLEETGIRTNVTLVFSPNQALIAAKAGASFISIFVGRIDDVGHSGMAIVKQTLEILEEYDFRSQLIVASIRHPLHVVEAARMGAPIATMPFKIMEQLFKHPLTDIGLDRFQQDWVEVKRKRAMTTTPPQVGRE